jgi:outer membrane protein assembly factor BamA
MAHGIRGRDTGVEPLSARLLLPITALALLGCRGPGAQRSQDEEKASHDPLEGMEPSGRIPKVALPPDVPNPERWRYLPEGRIVHGDFFDRFLVSTFAVPVFFYKSDVGAGGGVSLTDIDFRGQRRREFATATLTYTTEGQQNYGFLWRRWLDHRDLPGGGVIQEERSFVRVFAGYSKTLTRRFFGFGPETEPEDETSYSEEVSAVDLGYQESLPEAGDDWVVEAGLRVEKRNLSDGFVDGVPDTEDDFPAEFADGDDTSSLWVSGGLRYDTRDSQANPYHGWAAGGWFAAAPLISGGRAGWQYGLESTAAFTVPPLFHDGGDDQEENPPTDVIACTFQAQDSSGELPFWALPNLGGSSRLRGYIANRWTDEAAWFAAAEYRFAVVPRGFAITDEVRAERVGLALFYELGAVASSFGALDDVRVRDSVGFGLRVGLERSANFRFDVGFSDEDTIFTLLYGLSF